MSLRLGIRLSSFHWPARSISSSRHCAIDFSLIAASSLWRRVICCGSKLITLQRLRLFLRNVSTVSAGRPLLLLSVNNAFSITIVFVDDMDLSFIKRRDESGFYIDGHKFVCSTIVTYGYSRKIGINKMNYMFVGNNDSFVVFHTILDLPLRTAGV